MNINLDKIRIDCGTQARAALNEETVAEYAEAILAGALFPPVTVFFDGSTYYLADGFHRYMATKTAGSPGIDANVINGTLREAILHSLSVNHDHGLRRTNADKRKAVITMLQDFEWADWSDREIAKWCRVGHQLVGQIRKEFGSTPDKVKFERGGKVVEMGKQIKPKKDELSESHVDDHPDAKNETDEEKEQLFEAVDILKAENQALTDRLAVVSVSPEQAEREMAQSLIADLRAQIRLLEVELKSVKQSRDTYQAEKAELMKQNAMLQRKLKKQEGDK
jgi:hypothetical protein